MGKFSVKITIEIVVKAIMRIGTLKALNLNFDFNIFGFVFFAIIENYCQQPTITACLILN
jgi:hypothetical protein